MYGVVEGFFSECLQTTQIKDGFNFLSCCFFMWRYSRGNEWFWKSHFSIADFVAMTPNHMWEMRCVSFLTFFFLHKNVFYLNSLRCVLTFCRWYSTISIFCTNKNGWTVGFLFYFLTTIICKIYRKKIISLFKHFTFTNAYKLTRKFEVWNFVIVIMQTLYPSCA